MVNAMYKTVLYTLSILDLLFPLATLSCEWSWKNRSTPEVVGIDAYIETTSGLRFQCVVNYFYLPEPSFTLRCANGSQIFLGRSPLCGNSHFPSCEYSLVTDRKGQQFKMSEILASGWDKKECKNDVATTVMNYRLSQDAFSFDAKITIRIKAAKKITPFGF